MSVDILVSIMYNVQHPKVNDQKRKPLEICVSEICFMGILYSESWRKAWIFIQTLLDETCVIMDNFLSKNVIKTKQTKKPYAI